MTILINTQGPTRPDAVAAAVVDAALGTRFGAAVPQPPSLRAFVGRYATDVDVSEATDTAGRPVLRLKRGPLPPVLLRVAAHADNAWTFTDGRARYTFESGSDGTFTMWADLGVALVRWERGR